MTQPTPRERIENLWDRAVPVAPLLDAVVAETRADAFDEAANVFQADADETTRAARANYDPDMARVAKQFHAVAAKLRRMAEEARS